MQRHAEPPGVFDAPEVEDLGPGGGQFQHLLAGDAIDLLRRQNDPGVRGVDTIDVCVDLADVGLEGCGQCHGRRVRTAAAECGDLVGGTGHALETGNNGDVALVQGGADAVRVDVDDPGFAVDAVRDHAGLGAS